VQARGRPSASDMDVLLREGGRQWRWSILVVHGLPGIQQSRVADLNGLACDEYRKPRLSENRGGTEACLCSPFREGVDRGETRDEFLLPHGNCHILTETDGRDFEVLSSCSPSCRHDSFSWQVPDAPRAREVRVLGQEGVCGRLRVSGEVRPDDTLFEDRDFRELFQRLKDSEVALFRREVVRVVEDDLPPMA
jgi:hypothetical protein